MLGTYLVELNHSSNQQQHQKVSTPRSSLTGLLEKFAIKTTVPTFGGAAAFSSNLDRTSINSSQSSFGHISFGSNMPSFSKIADTNKLNHDDECNNSMPEMWSVKKITISNVSDVPVILQAVGLCKIEYKAPKCYGKKRLPHVTRSDVTFSEIDFNVFDFGVLDWEE